MVAATSNDSSPGLNLLVKILDIPVTKYRHGKPPSMRNIDDESSEARPARACPIDLRTARNRRQT